MGERQNNHLYHTNCTTTKKRRIHCRHRTNSTVQYQDFHLILILYNTIGSLLDHCFCGVNLALRFRFISRRSMPSARMPPKKAGVRRCTGCAGFVTISIMLLMDPAVDAVGGWTTRTMYQRSCSAHLSVPVLPYHSAALTRTKIFTAAKKCCILRCKDILEKILWTGSKCYE